MSQDKCRAQGAVDHAERVKVLENILLQIDSLAQFELTYVTAGTLQVKCLFRLVVALLHEALNPRAHFQAPEFLSHVVLKALSIVLDY